MEERFREVVKDLIKLSINKENELNDLIVKSDDRREMLEITRVKDGIEKSLRIYFELL